MFEIELRSSVDLNAADSFESYSHEEKEKISLDELLVVANSIREVSTSNHEASMHTSPMSPDTA